MDVARQLIVYMSQCTLQGQRSRGCYAMVAMLVGAECLTCVLPAEQRGSPESVEQHIMTCGKRRVSLKPSSQ